MTKTELRKLYINKRDLLSESEINQNSQKVLDYLKSFDWSEKKVFHLFLPIDSRNELNTLPIIDFLFNNGKRVVVPKVEGDEMFSCELKKGFKTVLGRFNIPEPETCNRIDKNSIDVMLLPMLICDMKGNRIGYGGGYYDRFLEKYEDSILKIGINHFPPIPEISEVESHDIRLDYCVSPDGIVSFTS